MRVEKINANLYKIFVWDNSNDGQMRVIEFTNSTEIATVVAVENQFSLEKSPTRIMYYFKSDGGLDSIDFQETALFKSTVSQDYTGNKKTKIDNLKALVEAK